MVLLTQLDQNNNGKSNRTYKQQTSTFAVVTSEFTGQLWSLRYSFFFFFKLATWNSKTRTYIYKVLYVRTHSDKQKSSDRHASTSLVQDYR